MTHSIPPEARPESTPKADHPRHKPTPADLAEQRLHIEENLDEGLEETFPASDPVSISPGAD